MGSIQSLTTASNEAQASTVLMWTLILLLVVLLVAVAFKVINKLRGDNKVYYDQKGAINLRVDRLPDLRIATKSCNSFKVRVYDKTMLISYANPFGGVKEFKCNIVGDPVKKPFEVKFTEQSFKKFCMNLKPGKIAFTKTKVIFNYNKSVPAKLTYLKKEV